MKVQVLISVLIIGSVSSCQTAMNKENEPVSPQQYEPDQTLQPVSTEVIIFKNDTSQMPEAGGYGYIIKLDGNPYIFQATIPAISGNKGFTNVMDAEKTAGLVAYKLRNHINPPSVSVAELDSLGISK